MNERFAQLESLIKVSQPNRIRKLKIEVPNPPYSPSCSNYNKSCDLTRKQKRKLKEKIMRTDENGGK